MMWRKKSNQDIFLTKVLQPDNNARATKKTRLNSDPSRLKLPKKILIQVH